MVRHDKTLGNVHRCKNMTKNMDILKKNIFQKYQEPQNFR